MPIKTKLRLSSEALAVELLMIAAILTYPDLAKGVLPWFLLVAPAPVWAAIRSPSPNPYDSKARHYPRIGLLIGIVMSIIALAYAVAVFGATSDSCTLWDSDCWPYSFFILIGVFSILPIFSIVTLCAGLIRDKLFRKFTATV